MLRHLPTGTRESLGERASWRSLGAFLPVLASGVFCFAFFDASILAPAAAVRHGQGLNEGLAVLLVTVVRDRRCVRRPRSAGGRPGRDSPRASELRRWFSSLSLLALPLMLGSRIQLMAIVCCCRRRGGALCVLSLVRAGKRFNGQKLIMINALFGFSVVRRQRCRAGSQRAAC